MQFGVPFTRVGFRSTEDEDEDYYDRHDAKKEICFPSVVVRWAPKAKREICAHGHLPAKSLLISYGQSLPAFTESYILSQHTELIGVICTGTGGTSSTKTMGGTLGQTALTDSTNYIYRLKRDTDTVIVNLKSSILPEQASSLVNQVIGRLDPLQLKVISLSTSFVSSYKSEDPASLKAPFMRCLVTNSFAHDTSVPYLEQPNILEGLSAAVLTFCQLRRIPAVAYCCYTDIMGSFDSSVVSQFLKLSDISFMKKFVSVSDKAKKQYEHFVTTQNSMTSYVYL